MIEFDEIPPIELPQGWEWLPLGKIGRWGSGGTPKRGNKAYFGGDIPWVKIGDLNDGVVTTTEESITDLGLANSSAKLIPPNVVLIAMYGASIGKMGMTGVECTTNQAIASCDTFKDLVDPWFLFWTLRKLRKQFIGDGKGGGQDNISQTVLKKTHIAVPPKPEQLRIVNRLNDLLERERVLAEKINLAQRNLASLKGALLNEAVRGELVVPEYELVGHGLSKPFEPVAEVLRRLELENDVARGKRAAADRPVSGLTNKKKKTSESVVRNQRKRS